jgi:hypothetical protein
MGGELIAVIAVAGGEGDDRLAALLHLVELFAERGERRLPAAEETVEVERDRLDPVVVPGGVERGDEILQFELAGDIGRADQRRDRIGPLGLLDQHPVEIHRQNAVPDRRRPSRQRRVEQAEEHQHEQQDQHVLDAHQQLPDGLHEPHFTVTPSLFGALPRAEYGDGPMVFDRGTGGLSRKNQHIIIIPSGQSQASDLRLP